jgi:hypothetical protein
MAMKAGAKRSSIPLLTIGLLLCAAFSGHAQNIGDTMVICTWAKELPTDQAMGYKYCCIFEGKNMVSAGSAIDSYTVVYQYVEGQWRTPQPPFPSNGMSVLIYLQMGMPGKISYYGQPWIGPWWITGIKATWDLIGTVEFYYPILPGPMPYSPADSFVINYDTNTQATFSCTTYPEYFGSLILFKGTVMQGDTDLTANFPMVLVPSSGTPSNPYHLAGVIAPAQVLKADNLGCFTCWHALYGLELLSYSPLAKKMDVSMQDFQKNSSALKLPVLIKADALGRLVSPVSREETGTRGSRRIEALLFSH